MSKKLAKKVIDTFPSFDEMLEDLKKSLYYQDRKSNPHFLREIQDSKGKWYNYQIISDVVQSWLSGVTGRPFYSFYSVRTKAYTGSATVLDAQGREYKVNGHYFIALLKIIFMSYSQMWGYSKGLTQEQIDAQDEFKFNVENMYEILD